MATHYGSHAGPTSVEKLRLIEPRMSPPGFWERRRWRAFGVAVTLWRILPMLIGLQAVQVAILWFHDWVPLGRLNDVSAVQAQDTRGRLIRVTLIQSLPFTVGLAASVIYARTGHPRWLWAWLWVSYGILFAGEIRAWWWPYLVRSDPERAARYRAMFGGTSAFLPERHGIVPNTLHVLLHASTAMTLISLALQMS